MQDPDYKKKLKKLEKSRGQQQKKKRAKKCNGLRFIKDIYKFT